MNTEHVIINADDLGISEDVNEAIFELMALNRVSSATVMANGPALRHASSRIKYFPRCSFGAHLNLSQFEPVRSGPGARLLTDPNGHLSRNLGHQQFWPKLLWAMYEELCAQVELLGSLGIQISHFDSHHHVHTRPQLLPVLKAVQKRFAIRKVRISKNIYTPQQPLSPALRRRKLVYNWVLRNLYMTHTTEGFTELLSYRTELSRRTLPYKSVELMVHPGAAYAVEETAVLKSDWMAASGLAARLISYSELAA
jgi:predicted glycoside hydrolase/deacetylase ChbG (UPF0249 family)